MKVCLLIIGLIISIHGKAQTLSIEVPNNAYGIDETLFLIVSRIQDMENYQDIGNYDEILIALGGDEYSFISNPESLAYSNSYTVENTSSLDQYILYFTELPLVMIDSEEAIVDEPKILASLIYTDDQQTINSNIGIELRGGFSQSYPKKTYDLEFWEDENGDETIDFQIGGLREDDDWILDALYNEPIRLRSYVASKLWKEMHSPYYINEEEEAKSGADVMYVELFLNGLYNGIYNISEQIDRKQLKLKKYSGEMKGELYKGSSWGGAVTFEELPSYNNEDRFWGGYEFKYPSEDAITDWNNIYEFTEFVMYSPKPDFESNIWSEFSKDNFIDYFLFLNLILAIDNTGKNIYVAKYKADELYFYVPWDLDGCFGTNWEGKNLNFTGGILTNGFMDRVINLNSDNTFIHLAEKWFEYRDNLFSNDYLLGSISELYNYFQTNKIYERESIVYTNYAFDDQSLDYILNWLESRLEYLDTYFESVLSAEMPLSPTTLTIYPNPAKDEVYISSIDDFSGKSYKIVNNLGQLVSTGTLISEQILIEKLGSGIYFLFIDGISFKLIKN